MSRAVELDEELKEVREICLLVANLLSIFAFKLSRRSMFDQNTSIRGERRVDVRLRHLTCEKISWRAEDWLRDRWRVYIFIYVHVLQLNILDTTLLGGRIGILLLS